MLGPQRRFNVKTSFLKPVLNLQATGVQIKKIMNQKGISARQLQSILDFPYVQTVYNWWAGKNMPTIDNLVVLAQILGVKMEDLIVTSYVEVFVDVDKDTGTVLELSA